MRKGSDASERSKGRREVIPLVTWLWQGLAISVTIAILLALARRLSAASRHVVWWLSLVAVVMLPAAYAAVRRAPPHDVPQAAITPSDVAVPLPAAPDWLLTLVAGTWLCALTLGCVRIALSVRTVFRLKQLSEPLDPIRASRLNLWSAVRLTGRQPCLCVSESISGACALGLGRPVILVSRALVDRLDDRELDCIVMHERAHLGRYDDWTCLAEALVAAVAGLHPAVWFIGRRIRFEREAACDDQVVVRTGAVRDYARSLIQAATAASAPGCGFHRLAIPGMTPGRSVLGGRVRRLLDPVRDRGTRLTVRTAAASVAALVGAVGLGARSPAIVVFVETAVERPPAAALGMFAGAVPTRRPSEQPALSAPVSAGSSLKNEARIDRGPVGPTAIAAIPQLDLPVSLHQAEPVAPPQLIPVAARLPADIFGERLALDPPPAPERAATPGSASRSPWAALARSAASTGHGVARAGAGTGARARDAGVSVGRLFSRTGKSVAGSF